MDKWENYELLNIPSFQKLTKGEGVKIAVLDSEIDLTHPEFKNKNITYKEFIDSNNHNYHGTAVSSLICGETLGVAPEAELYHLKMLSDEFGSGKSWDRAFSYAMSQDVDLICMSIGTKAKLSASMEQSIQNASDKGIVMVSPSGNEGLTVLRNPANNENVMAVGGIAIDRKLAKKSNKSKFMEGYAPSENILVADTRAKDLYSSVNGTSFANAIYVGQLALLLSYIKNNVKDSDINIRKFMAEYNASHREQRKVIDMNMLKEYIDIYFSL